jgi:hypothetical protein
LLELTLFHNVTLNKFFSKSLSPIEIARLFKIFKAIGIKINKNYKISMKVLLISIVTLIFICTFILVAGVRVPIAISTDKKVYALGEPVYIYIKNKSGRTIRESITLIIKDEKGRNIDETIFMLGWSPLRPGETIEHEWNQKGKIDGYGQVSEGKYIIWALMRGYKASKEIEIRSNGEK